MGSFEGFLKEAPPVRGSFKGLGTLSQCSCFVETWGTEAGDLRLRVLNFGLGTRQLLCLKVGHVPPVHT